MTGKDGKAKPVFMEEEEEEALITATSSKDMTEVDKLIKAMQQMLLAQQGMTEAISAPRYHHNTPKISIKIPIFKGDPKENANAWSLQCHTVFEAQNIDNS